MKIPNSFKNVLLVVFILSSSIVFSQKEKQTKTISVSKVPFVWEAANVYFLVTDRFNNGDNYNDFTTFRTEETALLRGFMGGDIQGITKKIREGYFANMGINVLWFTPIFEQTKGMVDEGTGNTYAFHGYWPRDWTTTDPNFGTESELRELVDAAHQSGIRILFDVVLNHIGPTTELDAPWPAEWVRTDPTCQYTNYENTTSCTLVKNLPDVKTDSNENVALPKFLVDKWKKEGRYDKEIRELDEFFERTKYPRAPRYYVIKWLTDYVKELGIDGFRFDTVKHLEESVFNDVKTESLYSLDFWKTQNPDKVLDDNKFFLLGEVYGYGLSAKRQYDFSDKKVDYFSNGFNSLINFQFSYNAKENDYEKLFSMYNDILQSEEMKGNSVLNYISSHDDPNCFDKERVKPYESANKLLLCPGSSQVYYGDESLRPLAVEGAKGDAKLRSFMNWNDITNNTKINGFNTKDIQLYWQKLGRFRINHPAIGVGVHEMITASPYVFSRIYKKDSIDDRVVVGINLPKGKKEIAVGTVFENGKVLKDTYSGKIVTVKNSKVIIDTDTQTVLLELKK